MKRAVFVEDGDAKAAARDPRQADAFACDLLIPPADYERFCANDYFSLAAVRRFANRMGIAPGIVAGRLTADEAALDYLATRIAPKFCASTEVAAAGKTLAIQ